MRAAFLVQIRFGLERRWRTYRNPPSLPVAMAVAKSLVDVRFTDSNTQRVFENVRIRYRNLTLIRWSWGSEK